MTSRNQGARPSPLEAIKQWCIIRLPPHTLRIVTLAVLFGLTLCSVGMHLYPGGSGVDPGARGYSFFQNFLCDATRAVAINGSPNGLGRQFMRSGLTLLAVGFLPLWCLIPQLLAKPTLAAAIIRWCGISGTALMTVVIYGGHDSAASHHLLYVGGPLCTVALATTIAELSLQHVKSWALLIVTTGLGVTSMVDLFLYSRAGSLAALAPSVPAIQKMVFILAVLWMLLAAAAISRSSVINSMRLRFEILPSGR